MQHLGQTMQAVAGRRWQLHVTQPAPGPSPSAWLYYLSHFSLLAFSFWHPAWAVPR